MSDVRSRNWLFVFYPDSASDDWSEVIDSWGVTCYVSPVHDLDVTKDGELKKPHYHGVLCFEGNKSYRQVVSRVSQLGASHAIVCESLRNALRYLCHLDHPNKARYEVDNIRTYGYADLSALHLTTDMQKGSYLLGIFDIIEGNDIVEFATLVDVVRHNCPAQVFNVLRENHAFIRSYMQGRYFAARTISGQVAQGC